MKTQIYRKILVVAASRNDWNGHDWWCRSCAWRWVAAVTWVAGSAAGHTWVA